MRSSLRTAGLAATLIGAIASVALLVYVGNRRGSNEAQPIVMALIGIWVVSPFVILLAASALSKGWSPLTRTTLYITMIVITVLSMIVYTLAATGPIRAKPAAPFVGIPPVSWVLIAASLAIAALVSRKRNT